MPGNALNYLVFLACYLVGAIPFGFLVGLARGVDVRKFGSGNIGATNVFRVLGPVAAVALVLDVGKGLTAAALGVAAFPHQPALQVLAGLVAVAGHNWSVFLRFRGGKGVAATAGVFLYLMPTVVGLAILIFLAVVAITRYVSLGSIVLALSMSAEVVIAHVPTAFQWATWIAALVIVYQHRSNISRLLRGTESRFGQRVKLPKKDSGPS